MKNKHCEWCDHQFQTIISYQIYCSPTCREAATKEKISQRYLLTRIKNRKGKNRKCTICKTPLSIYNDEKTCSKCNNTPDEISKTLKEIKRLSNGKD
jgi:hypothetical protein